MLILEEQSSFTLYRDYSLSERDRQVLSLLYLPIIKSDAFSLYFRLNDLSYLKLGQDYFYHQEVRNQLGLTIPSFLRARSLLEGIGLRETFRKTSFGDDGRKKVTYIYHLLPPASPKKFFSDLVLKSLLISEIGNKKYFSIRNYFKAAEPFKDNDAENVSCSFKDAYSSKLQGDERILLSGDSLQDKNYKSPIQLDEKGIISGLEKTSYPIAAVEKDRKEIAALSSLYGINKDDICSLIEKNTDSNGKFYRDTFKDSVRNFISYGKKEVEIDEKDISGSNKEARFRQAFQSRTPKEYLTQVFNADPTKPMLMEIEDLRNRFGFDNSIINVILDYSLRRTKKEFNKVFIEKVAFKLSGYQVSSVYDARAVLKSRDFEVQRSLGRKKTKSREEEAPKKEKVSKEEMVDIAKSLGL